MAFDRPAPRRRTAAQTEYFIRPLAALPAEYLRRTDRLLAGIERRGRSHKTGAGAAWLQVDEQVPAGGASGFPRMAAPRC
ncbi:Hypothetical protein NTJ_03221 [Nesidiocoris tenuis]|uniref:Uncharacterized protein n=1 Tax=Nesidiocoris tenuis TaxID=355587 RepID=A0ABN7AEJ1_9HEMI|nr:Hypothetical protein NTJ_03221 [Nesidiocoris tenuis]